MAKKNKKITAKKPEEFLAFAKVWNDARSYPANYDMERRLGEKISVIRETALRYDAYRLENPTAGLPALILRRVITGGIVAVPEGVLQQLDPFRFDVAKLDGAKTVVVTSAQFGADLNIHFWKALMQYEKERGAVVVVMPIKYGPITMVCQEETGDQYLTSTFPDELNGRIIFNDMFLCDGELALNVTRMRPTLRRFLTDSICEMGGLISQILAGPKLELAYRPRVGHRWPKAIMTTGACTYPRYHVDNLGQQDRTGEVATEAHTFSGIVVEIDRGSFHFRQLHANKRGEFYDINPKKGGADFFTQNGVKHCPDGVSALLAGDWHAGITDPRVRFATFGEGGMVQLLKPKSVVIHDFFDGVSISHHEQKQATRRAYKAKLLWDSLEKELLSGKKELDWMRKSTTADIFVVASNHPEFVAQYIDELHWTKDNCNLRIGAQLYLEMVNDLERRNPRKHKAKSTDPVVSWFSAQCPTIKMLGRQDTLLLPEGVKHPILCSMHGDKGTHGGKTHSLGEFEKMNQRVFIGHNHSAAILHNIWRLGTSTPLMQHYVTSPATNWTHTHGIIFKNGQRQLINIVKGKWYSKQQWKEDVVEQTQ